MSRRELKKTFNVDEDEEDVEVVKCSPQQIPSSNLSEESASRQPTISHKHHHHLHYKHEHQDEEAVAMEEGVLVEKEEKIEGASNLQNLVAKEEIGIEYPGTSGGQHSVSPSRRIDVSPGAEALGTEVPHRPEGRCTQITQVRPGAFREGGLDNEEEDEHTIQSNAELLIPPTLLAELVDTAEEERRRQDDINQALQRERLLVQDQINQALKRERQQAAVAEVIPEVISRRDRQWKFAGAFLLLLLIVVGVVLGITLRLETDTEPETPIPQGLIDLLSNASSDNGGALKTPSTPQYEALEWLANNTNLAIYSDQEKIQRYALATLYYSTMGDSWTRRDKWLSNADLCDWYQYEDSTIDCTSAGAVSSLSLYNNSLFGVIPPEIGMLSDSLVRLYLTTNDLGGTLPNEIALLTKLTALSFQNNSLIGTIPSIIGLLTNLQVLSLNSNEFTGIIPSEIGRLTKLQSGLYLEESNLTGTIPTTLGSLIMLEEIFLRFNALEGPIPTELAQCQNLKIVDFSNNTLTGDVGPIINMLPRYLTVLDLKYNGFSGTVPTSMGTFTDLYWLGLGGNNLNGTIPTSLGLLSNLEWLGLHLNRLTGTIPTSLGSLSLLKKLFLYENDLNGTIPTSLGLLSNLEVLSLWSNRLTGTIPTSLASLPLLKLLLLSDNDLTGSVNAFCGIGLEYFAVNNCSQDEIECACCNACCDPGVFACEPI